MSASFKSQKDASSKRNRSTGNLNTFLFAASSSSPVLNPKENSSSDGTSGGMLPSLGSRSPVQRPSSNQLRSITSSILWDANKNKAINRLTSSNTESQEYFMRNIVTPSDSQKIIQLLTLDDAELGLGGSRTGSGSIDNAASHRSNSRKINSRHATVSLTGLRMAGSTVGWTNRGKPGHAENKHFDKINKYSKYSALYRSLGNDITNGTDEDGAEFIKCSLDRVGEPHKSCSESLQKMREKLEVMKKKPISTSGSHQLQMLKMQEKVDLAEKRQRTFDRSIRLSSAEGRARNKDLIDATKQTNESIAESYGYCPSFDEDEEDDQRFLERHNRSKTASAAFLREGCRRKIIPFGVQEFLDSLLADVERKDVYYSSESLVSVLTLGSLTSGAVSAEGEEDVCGGSIGGSSVVSVDSHDGKVVTINVSKWGLGDTKALCLAAALPSCLALRSLDISSNRLTDTSCAQILRALLQLSTLTYLNLSDNKLDDRSIEPLRQNLASRGCSITHLHLAKSDVDDDECAKFMEAMRTNTSVTVLNLSQNKIGEMEEHTIVFPAYITGGMAIANVFTENTTLTELDLSWNCLRHNTALIFAKSLASNNTLRYLNLAKNNIGDLAAQYLGHALLFNTTMTKLDLSYNNILPRGIMVLANALENHTNMRDVQLNGNCVGELGSKSLLRSMRLAATKSRNLKVSFRDANVYFQDRSLFNRHEPRQGVYNLSLSNPYDYMIAYTLYDAFNGKLGASFADLKFRPPSSKIWDKIPLKRPDVLGSSNAAWSPHLQAINSLVDAKIIPLAKIVAQDSSVKHRDGLLKFRSDLLQAIRKLGEQLGLSLPTEVAHHIGYLLESTDPSLRQQIHQIFRIIFRAVFRIVDKDKSFSVDREELAKCLALLGVSFAAHPALCLDYASRMIAGVDVDGSGTLDEVEFVRMLFVNYTETYPAPPLPLIDARTGHSWFVPTEGELMIDFISEKLPPSLEELQSDDAIKSFSGTLESTVDPGVGKEAMIKDSVSGDMFLTCEQAEMLLTHFSSPLVDNKTARRNAVEHFAPQMTTTVEACRFLAQNMNIKEIFRLRRKWGTLFSAVTGLACGHFFFNLNNDLEKKAAKRLAQLNSLYVSKAKVENPTRDTSQCGNFENFRNAQFNCKAIALSSTFFSELPTLPLSKLKCDFVNTSRPVPGIEASSDEAVENLIDTIFSAELNKHIGRDDDDDDGDDHDGDDLYEGQDEEKREGQGHDEHGNVVFALEPSSDAEIAEDDSDEEENMKARADMQAQRVLEEEQKAADALKNNKRPGAGLLAGVKKQAELTRLATERMLLRQNRKIESLEAILERQLNEAYAIQWEDYYDSTKLVYRLANIEMQKEALAAAMLDETVGEGRAAALGHKIFRDARGKALSDTDLQRFLEQWRKLARKAHKKYERELAEEHAGGHGLGSKHRKSKRAKIGHTQTRMLTLAERADLVARSMAFEKNLQMLECYLIYNMWLSCDQVKTICDAFLERGAPDGVVVRVICTTFCRIIDLENLHHVFAHPSIEERPFIRDDVIHRLGVLNVMSAVQPDGVWKFDLAAHDEREAAKLLVRLAVIESGPEAVHFVHAKYAKSMLEPTGEDFPTPTSWHDAEPGGVPKFGTWSFFFKSTVDSNPPTVHDRQKSSKKKNKHQSKHKTDVRVKSSPDGGTVEMAASGASSVDRYEAGITDEQVDERIAADQAYSPNIQARRELEAFKCLAGTRGTFVRGVSAAPETGIESPRVAEQTTDTDAIVSEADWAYVQGICSDPGSAAETVLDVVGFANVYFGPAFKAPVLAKKEQCIL